ncbi:MAG TPA: energy transducer TonB [Pyrinomonadaceae bacterium]|jgi:TonB family protein
MKKLVAVLFSFLFFAFVFAGTSNAQTNNQTDSTENQKTAGQLPDQPLKIEKKPHSRTDGRCSTASGTIRLRVTFDKSAKVTNVEIVSPSSCSYFDEQAVKAAKKIKFKPAIKNGEAVTVVKPVEYNFRIR